VMGPAFVTPLQQQQQHHKFCKLYNCYSCVDSLRAGIPEAWSGTVHKSAHRAVPETGAVMLMLDERLARGMRSSEEPTMAQTSFAAKALV